MKKALSRNSPSFFPPTKSIPSSIALTMNGVVAVVCSEIALARLHSASETFCGEKAGRELEAGEDEREAGGVGSCGTILSDVEEGGANSFSVSSISSSN